jgi:hypothetical protein
MRLLANLGRRSGSCGAIALVGEVLRSNEAMMACARKARFDVTDPHEDARPARIRKDIVCSLTLPIKAWNYSLNRSRSEVYFPPKSPETAKMRGELR